MLSIKNTNKNLEAPIFDGTILVQTKF